MQICPMYALAACAIKNTPVSCHDATDGAVTLLTADFWIDTGSTLVNILTYTGTGNTPGRATNSTVLPFLCCAQAYVR